MMSLYPDLLLRKFRGALHHCSDPLLLYILLFPSALLLLLAVPPGSDRFDGQWQALGCTASIAVGALLCNIVLLREFSDWLHANAIWHAVIFSWLSLLGISLLQGFSNVLPGLLSGIIFIGLAPLCLYLWLYKSTPVHKAIASICLLVLLLGENIFLAFHVVSAKSMSSYDPIHWNLPRLFVNVRDGNGLALASSVVAIVLRRECKINLPILSGFNSWQLSALRLGIWLLVFVNGWITQGRGLFVAVGFGLVFEWLISLKAYSLRHTERQSCLSFLGEPLLACVTAWLVVQVLTAFQGSYLTGEDMISRFSQEYGETQASRLVIWKAWLSSGWQTSWIYGHGMGVKPAALAWLRHAHTPHNLWVQTLADLGMAGVLLSVVITVWMWKCINSLSRMRMGPGGVYTHAVVIVYLSVASVLYWPMGIWLVTLVPATWSLHKRPSGQLTRGSQCVYVRIAAIALLMALAFLVIAKIGSYGFL